MFLKQKVLNYAKIKITQIKINVFDVNSKSVDAEIFMNVSGDELQN